MEIEGIEILPTHMRDTVRLYVLKGIPGGSFLNAVLSNKLVEAFSRADDMNAAAMRSWASWLHNFAPSGCWGSQDDVTAWVKHGGLLGLDKRGKP